MITYKIISANADFGQIEVSYFEDGKILSTFALDVPIKDGRYLNPQELDAEIMHRAPSWMSERKLELKNASGFDEILALVQQVTVEELTPEELANRKMWQQIEFEKKTAKALVKFGILQSDPTQIDVSAP